MKDILKTLVEFPTVSGDFAVNSQALDYIDAYLSERGMQITRYEWGGYESLVATIRPTLTPRVLLAAHLDVVPGKDELFALRTDGDELYGRGIYDMKFAIAAFMQLVDDLKDNLQSYDFAIMITTDEEMGGLQGTSKLVEHGYRPKVCVLPDGGEFWQIETRAKGWWWLTIEARGKSAHSSKPWQGESATFNLINVLNEIYELFGEQTLETSTINVGIIEAGTAQNQIPDSAVAKLDIRFMNMQEQARLEQEIQEICQKHNAAVTASEISPPCINELSNPHISAFARSIETITGVEVVGSKSSGASDARFFAPVGIPCVLAMPPGGGWHSNDEWVSEEGMYQFKDVLLDYLQNNANISVSEPTEALEEALETVVI